MELSESHPIDSFQDYLIVIIQGSNIILNISEKISSLSAATRNTPYRSLE